MAKLDFLSLPPAEAFRRTATLSLALCLGAVVLVFSQQFIHCFPPPKLLAQIAPLSFAFAAALAAGTARPKGFPLLPALLVILYCAAAGLRSGSPQALTLSFLPVASAVAASWLAASLAVHPSERARLWAAFVLIHLACCAYGIIQYFGLDWLTWSVEYGHGRVFSTIGNPNFLAGQMAFALPILAALCMARRGLMRLLAQFGVTAAFLTLILAQTRSAWIGIFAGAGLAACCAFFCVPARRFAWRALLGPGIAILIAVLLFSFPRFNPTGVSLPAQLASSFDVEQASARQRIFWWLGSMELLKGNPLLGVGLGEFPRAFPPAARRFCEPFADLKPAFCDHPHNDYLFLLNELGILGMGLILWLAAVWARILFRFAGHKPLSLGVLAALAALAVHAIWNMPFRISATLLAAACAAGIALGSLARSPAPRPARHATGPRSRGLSLAIAGAVLLGGLALSLNPGTMLVAQSYLNGARIMKERSAFGPAIYLVRQSLKLSDAPWRQHFMLGSIHYGQGEGYYSLALDEFRQDELENPWGADAVLHQGKALRQLGRYAEAEERSRYALKLVPNYTAAAVTIASLEYFRAREKRDTPAMQPHLKQAETWLTYALRFSPGDPEALKLRGYVAIMSGQWALARNAWTDYLAAKPKDEVLRSRLASLNRVLPRLLAGETLEDVGETGSHADGQ